MCPGQIKARALPIYTFLFLKKDATRTHSPLFRTSAQSWASVLLKAGLYLSLLGATDGSEPPIPLLTRKVKTCINALL